LRQVAGGSEEGSYLRLIDFVFHSTLGLRVIEKKKRRYRGQYQRASNERCARVGLADYS